MKIIWALRSIVFILLQTASVIIVSLVGFLLWFSSDKVKYAYLKLWVGFVVFLLRFVCGVRYQIHGKENLDLTQPGLILARHESAWETFVFQIIFPRLAFVLKKELLNIPFFGWGLRMTSPIAIDRGAGRKAMKQVLDEGLEKLTRKKDPSWVVIFPEGTRMSANKLGKINSGGALLAKKAKVKTYLVAHNAGNCWAAKNWIIKPGKVDVFISKPLDVERIDTAEINKLIEEWFKTNLDL
jgi:1-acyl-sn-glycerol-3-phosphate acyltransferase